MKIANVFGVFVSVILGGGMAAAPAYALEADFDWSMPDRFAQDRDGDGLPDYAETVSDIQPASWRVDFDACAAKGDIQEYSWYVDDVFKGKVSQCSAFSATFAEEGTYLVKLVVKASDGAQSMAAKFVNVQDWLILAIGDSYGSGEGNPHRAIVQGVEDNIELAKETAQKLVQQLNNALSDLALKKESYEKTKLQVKAVRDALDRWLQTRAWRDLVCNLFGGHYDALACTDAILQTADRFAELVVELTKLGLQSLKDSVDAIRTALNKLEQDAENAVATAQESVDQALDALTPLWQDRRCHRSAYSGQALAARALEAADPRTSVTFVQLSCSGATIDEGLTGGYKGAEPPKDAADLEPQVDVLKKLVGVREIDALLVSIGGNDVAFADIITHCIAGEPCNLHDTYLDQRIDNVEDLMCGPLGLLFGDTCRDFFQDLTVASSSDIFEASLKKLPKAYDGLSDKLDEKLNKLPGNRVYITEYPNALRDDDGSLCSWEDDGLQTLPLMTLQEADWAETVVIRELNGAISDAATAHGWNYIAGPFDKFWGHGLCADRHWLYRIQESFLTQGDKLGSAHPNRAGHAAIGSSIHDSLQATLYEGGDLAQPRPPQQPPSADGGGPYYLIEGEQVQLDNGSYDVNGDPMTFLWTLSPSLLFKVGLDDETAERPLLTAYDDADGDLELKVTANDAEDADTVLVHVDNAPPQVAVADDVVGNEGQPMELAVAFSDPGTLDTHTALIEWENGPSYVVDPAVSPLVLAHTYADNGVFSLEITVTDDDGGEGHALRTVTVNNVAPTVDAGPDQEIWLRETVDFSGSFYDPGVLDTHQLVWAFGDGSESPNALITSHTYAASGSYEVRLTVTDNDGGIGTDTLVVRVKSAQDGVRDIAEGAQGLPAESWSRLPGQTAATFVRKLDAVLAQIAGGEYEEAITKLQDDLRAKTDGSAGGNPADDWIVSPDAQAVMIALIDDLVAYLRTLA